MQAERKVLVIEDNSDIAALVSLHLKDLDCEVSVANDGAKGFARAQDDRFDLIILDLMLPEMDGLEVCRRLRADSDFTPILMLTAKSSEVDRVVGLEMGADDYLVKPFNIHELLARVKAIFRRAEVFTGKGGKKDKAATLRKLGGLELDSDKRAVRIDGTEIDLTAKEFDLLAHFIDNPGRVYSRQQLMDTVWGHGYFGFEHTVNSHINRLRGKIEKDSSKPEYVLTVWGVGYKFNDQLS